MQEEKGKVVMDIVKWSVEDIIPDNEYTGKIINGYLVLNRIKGSLYYAMKDNRLYTIDFDTNEINVSSTRKPIIDKYKNPYINIKNNITVIFTSKLNEIYIDTDNYYKVKNTIIQKNTYRPIDTITKKCLKHIIFGEKAINSKVKNENEADLRRNNLVIIKREAIDYGKKGSKVTKELKKFNNGKYYNIQDIKGVVSNDKLEGKAFGNIQVLNRIDDNYYYVRVEDNGEYYLAIENEDNIIRKRMRLKKRKYLYNGNPYLELNDKTVLVYTTLGYVLRFDRDTFYNKIIGNMIYVQKRNNEKSWKHGVSIKLSNGDILTLSNHLGLLDGDKNKFVAHRNGDILDFRKDNIAVVNRVGYVHRLMKYDLSISKRNGKYDTYLGIDGKDLFLGTFKTKEEAINARKKAINKYWGLDRDEMDSK